MKKDTVNQDIRKKLKIPEEAFLILSVGELNANKNQKIIIDALSLLQDKDIYYVLCGSGKNLKTLQAQSRKCQLQDNIRFVDYRRDIINFYDQADVFVLPSYREGMPIALLEAMSYHRPVVVSAIPANLEVGLDKESYFQVGDVDALAGKLQRMVDMPYREMHYDMSKYNWDTIADQVGAVYDSLA